MAGTHIPSLAAQQAGPAIADGGGCRRPFWLALLVIASAIIAASAAELSLLGWHPAREEAAAFSAYHWLRMAGCAIAAALLVHLMVLTRDRGLTRHVAPGAAMTGVGLVSLGTGIGFALLFAIDPPAFHLLSAEDHALEWISAALPLIGALFFLAAALRQAGRAPRLDLLIALGLAACYFCIGMEEISWGQRLIGYSTPETVARVNWQGEFNLHNVNTDIFELVYYSVVGLFLIVGPLARETMPSWPPMKRFSRFVPGRGVALVAAPLLAFTYGQWNLLPIQLGWFAGLFVLLALARSARGPGERLLFRIAAILLIIIQAAFLLLGPRMVYLVDASEYKEMFAALGLACFAAQYWARASRA